VSTPLGTTILEPAPLLPARGLSGVVLAREETVFCEGEAFSEEYGEQAERGDTP
jgi:hypothetical protein